MSWRSLGAVGLLLLSAAADSAGTVSEFPLAWPGMDAAVTSTEQAAFRHNHGDAGRGSTHELVFDHAGGDIFWVSGQAYDHIARVALDGSAAFFAMPKGSAPHGLALDARHQLWVTFEGLGEVARVDGNGHVVQRIDVRLHAQGTPAPINTHPHGLAAGPDGSLWFTGMLSNTVGRISADGNVTHFVLPTVGAVPIYLAAGPDGNMWCTELVGNRIARIKADGTVTEFAIPTLNSRPIVIAPGRDGRSMWFSEEAGARIARIDLEGHITEFPVPKTQDNAILAGLAFDQDGNLWTQQYVSPQAPGPRGDDYIVRLGNAVQHTVPGDLSGIPFSFYRTPSQETVMHRIAPGPGRTVWFTELGLDRIGRVELPREPSAN